MHLTRLTSIVQHPAAGRQVITQPQNEPQEEGALPVGTNPVLIGNHHYPLAYCHVSITQGCIYNSQLVQAGHWILLK